MMLPAILFVATLTPAVHEAAPLEPAATQEAAAPSGSAQEHIDAGLAAFRKRRFAQALGHFDQARQLDSSSAAARFYLGYTVYKMAERKKPFHPDKQRAASLFAEAFGLDPKFKPVWGPRK